MASGFLRRFCPAVQTRACMGCKGMARELQEPRRNPRTSRTVIAHTREGMARELCDGFVSRSKPVRVWAATGMARELQNPSRKFLRAKSVVAHTRTGLARGFGDREPILRKNRVCMGCFSRGLGSRAIPQDRRPCRRFLKTGIDF